MAEHVCPYWAGYLMLNPVRRFSQNPHRILGPFIKPGMTVLDLGPGLGYFSLPMARMVGPDGKVVCVDVQEKMIRTLLKRARRARLSDRIEGRVCSSEHLNMDDLEGKVAFAFASAVLHEVPNQSAFLHDVYKALETGGSFLLAEPDGHVPVTAFEKSVILAGETGFSAIDRPRIHRYNAVLFEKIQ